MFTEDSVEELKSRIDIVEVVEKFVSLKQRGGNFVGCCPFHKEKTPSFHVVPSGQYYKCFGCGESGDAIKFVMDHEKKSYPEALEYLAAQYEVTLIREGTQTYIKPEWKNKTDISDKIVKWFEGRGISQKTIQRLKITDGIESMIVDDEFKDINTIHFNYFRNDELTNIKYRGKDYIAKKTGKKEKCFKLHKGSELIFYNLDSIKGKKRVIITEGEPDCCAVIEAGYWNEDTGVISVPNGASKYKNNLIYLNNCIKEFANIQEFILGLDNDSNGRKLRDELAIRFGREKCKFIEWKDKKDGNEVLVSYGIQGIIECVGAAKKFPIEGVYTVEDFAYEIDNIYNNGLDKGVSIRLPDFALNIVKGYITTITGIAGSGKSEAVDEICLRLTKFHQQKGAFYSPENKPTELHYSKMARRIVGKEWAGPNRMTRDEEMAVREYLNNRIFFVKPKKDFQLESILESIRNTHEEHGLDYFVIDAWNKLEHKGTDTDYIGKSLETIANFCEANLLHLFLVAHPKKPELDKKTGMPRVPQLWDISGSNHFHNKTDNGLSIYYNEATKRSEWHRLKVKFSHWGYKGMSEYLWDKDSGRFYKEGHPDFTNWITGQKNKVPDSELFTAEQPIADFDKDEEPF